MIGSFVKTLFALVIPRSTRTAVFSCIVLYIFSATIVTIIGIVAIVAIVGVVGVILIPIVVSIFLVTIILLLF